MPVDLVPKERWPIRPRLSRTLTAALTTGSVVTTASTLSGRDVAGQDERLVPFRVPDATTAALLQVGDRISVVGATVDGGQSTWPLVCGWRPAGCG